MLGYSKCYAILNFPGDWIFLNEKLKKQNKVSQKTPSGQSLQLTILVHPYQHARAYKASQVSSFLHGTNGRRGRSTSSEALPCTHLPWREGVFWKLNQTTRNAGVLQQEKIISPLLPKHTCSFYYFIDSELYSLADDTCL